jgi:hypothetical protein
MNFFTPDFIQNCISRKRTKKIAARFAEKENKTQEGKNNLILKHFF